MKKTAVRALSSAFPGAFTQMAYRRLTQTRVKKLRPHELEVLATAQQEDLAYDGFTIRTYKWPSNGPVVMLMHGWEGQAGNFADFIEPLRAQGYSIRAFDAPSHGFSSKGATTLLEFVQLTRQLLEEWKPTHLLSHSFGSIPLTFSLSTRPEIKVDKFAMITTPNRFEDRIQQIADQVGISQKVQRRLTRIMEDKINAVENTTTLRAEDLNVEDFVQKAQVRKGLIVHDVHDKVIPIQQAERVVAQWSNAELVPIEGTGHFRILRTPSVIEKVISFLGQDT